MTYLVLIGRSHALHDLLSLRLGNTSLLSHDLAQNSVDFAGHVGCVTTDVEVGFLQEQLVDFFGVLLQSVLNIYLLGTFAGEGGDEGKFVAEGFFVFLFEGKSLSLRIRGKNTYIPFFGV